eukprot:GHVQ01040276.1.p1 GENE.GHVQ01040276.1~~GHVQ01040276.1.p1  ORF type:complete len:128 (-),score=14.02 GHVQ01040276.1:6-389(-)
MFGVHIYIIVVAADVLSSAKSFIVLSTEHSACDPQRESYNYCGDECLVCVCGVHVWCACVVCVCGVHLWCACVMCVCGVRVFGWMEFRFLWLSGQDGYGVYSIGREPRGGATPLKTPDSKLCDWSMS